MNGDLLSELRLSRRAMLSLTAAGSVSVLAGCHGPSRSLSPEQIALWPETPPGGGGPTGQEQATPSGALYNIREPRLEIFRPESPNGGVALVAAGGGYQRIGMRREAYPAARWLNARGITVFVLVYRLPGEGWLSGAMAPFQDARRALALVRQRVRLEKLDPARISLLGFSAGGHLMGLTASRWSGVGSPEEEDVQGRVAPLSGAALIYPVITLEKPYDRTATRRNIAGLSPDPAQALLWSVQSHVLPGYPPVFLTQADNDRIANPVNAALMAQACQTVGTEVEYHRLPSGGHGFGMGEPGRTTASWPLWYQGWLARRGMI
ncbi:alpha/beta hydrolase [Asaia astilbis]